MWFIFAGLYSSPVFAEAPCVQPLTRSDWEAALQAGDRYLSAGDYRNAARLVDWTHEHTHCLSTLVTPDELGKFAFQSMFLASLEQDTEVVQSWATLAKRMPPQSPGWLPAGHQVSSTYGATETTETRHRIKYSLAVPRGGGVFLNGGLILEPIAPQNTPNLLQVAGRKGEVVASRWQHGANFHRDWLAEPGAIAATPRWLEDAASSSPPRARLLQYAAQVGVASVALYGASWASRGLYEQNDYAPGYYQVTNGSLVASVVCAGVSLGLAGASLTGGR
jgi:hypothetical protein